MLWKKMNMKLKRILALTTIIFVLSGPLFLGTNLLNAKDAVFGEGIMENDEKLKANDVGYDLWWDTDFEYRSLINITNPYDEAFEDFITKISFNYTAYVNAGKMNSSLKDVRIVQEGLVREYYIEKDFPSTDIATVWFKVNITAGPIVQQDIYMYYGNNSIGFDTKLMDKNPDGLIWYKCEEGTGDKLIDSMGNYNATIFATGADLWDNSDPAVGDYSLTFTNNDYIAIEDLYFQGRNTIDELTVMVWFKTSDSSSSYTDNWAFLDFDRSETFNFFIAPGTGGGPTTPCTEGSIGFATSAQGSSQSTSDFFSSTDGLNDGAWHYAAATYDGQDKKIYINESLDVTDLNAHQGLALGKDTTRYGFIGDGSEATTFNGNRNNRYYTGTLDEIRFFEEALSADRIKWIYNNYELSTEINEEQIRFAQVSVIAKDVDGRVVPGVEVTLHNETAPFSTQITNNLGLAEFIEVTYGDYNITAKYTSSIGVEQIVFNSSEEGVEYSFDGLIYTVYIELDMWSIDFQIEDWNGDPMDQGFIEIWDSISKNTLVDNLTIEPDTGLQTFRWINTSSYYYEIYYDNPDYTPKSVMMNSSTILRSNYLNNFKTLTRSININQSAVDIQGAYYGLNEDYYSRDSNSSEIGNVKIIDVSVELDNMLERLHEIYLYTFSDRYNPSYYDPSGIYYESYVSETSDKIQVNLTELSESFGIRMELSWLNTTGNCNGTVDITFNQTCNQFVRLNMSKLEIRVFDYEGTPDPIQYVIVHVRNNSTKSLITSLVTDSDGIASGQTLSGFGFWYFNDVYEFELEFYETSGRSFNVSYSDQWSKGDFVTVYNYTLISASLLEFEMNINIDNFLSEFRNQNWDISADWGDIMSFSVNYTISSDGGSTYSAITNPDYVIYNVRRVGYSTVLLSGDMNDQGNGNYSITLDSGALNAGLSYTLSVYGSKIGYIDPDPAILNFQINTVPTSLTFHDYSATNQTITSISPYYSEMVNVSILYKNTNLDSPLLGATISYSWDHGSGSVLADTRSGYEEYYVLEIDTSLALDTRLYKFQITAVLENYTQIIVDFDVDILDRPTLLNSSDIVFYSTQKLFVFEQQNFTFEYFDVLNSQKIQDADQMDYIIWKLDENGEEIPGDTQTGILIEDSNHDYILDLDTETMDDGEYTVFITLSKDNYEYKVSYMTLEILKREFTTEFSPTIGDIISIECGASLSFTISLTDVANNSEPIVGAEVYILIGSTRHDASYTGNGNYVFNIPAIAEPFFVPETYILNLNIEKDYYETYTKTITTTVEMSEIFPGFPMFYFLMIVIGVVAVVGSLVAYRTIQIARIPTFVKRVRSMSKNIKSKKSISESLLYPSKEQYIVKELGDKWDTLGLSLEDILGVERKKGKKMPEIPETEGGNI